MSSLLAGNAARIVRLGRRSIMNQTTSTSVGRFPAARAQGPKSNKPPGKVHRLQSSVGGDSGGGKIGNYGGGRGSGGGGDSGGNSSPSGGSGPWGAYLSALNTNPILTKSITSAVLNAAGDVLSQLFFEEGNAFDWKRAVTFGFLGLALVGPSLHYWYGALARVISQSGTQGALLRLAFDQLAFAPAFIAVFFSSLLVLEGHPGDISAKLKQDWKSAVVANWKLWIPFQFINFRFVPQHLQVLAANVVAVGWNTYLSWKSHKVVGPELT